MTERILMIEDDESLSAMVGEYLSKRGIEVTAKPDAKSGLKLLKRGDFDALILDVMLPDLDGFEICRRVRAESDMPILMLTARGEDTDRIVGLELGADDYLPKPFNPRELLARLRAILRRSSANPKSSSPSLRFGRLEIDRDARTVRVPAQDAEVDPGVAVRLVVGHCRDGAGDQPGGRPGAESAVRSAW